MPTEKPTAGSPLCMDKYLRVLPGLLREAVALHVGGYVFLVAISAPADSSPVHLHILKINDIKIP